MVNGGPTLGGGIGQIAKSYPFVFISFIIIAWLFVSGPAIFGEDFEGYAKFLPMYAIFLIAGTLFGMPNTKYSNAIRDVMWFSIAFVASMLVFGVALRNVERAALPFAGAVLWATIAGQFVVASSEEILFRWGFIRLDAKPPIIYVMIAISGLVFGVFHFVAYSVLAGITGVNPAIAILQPAVLGTAFGFIFWKTKSIAAVIAIHLGFNLSMLGIVLF